ncbi:hypothetical protein BB561_003800 [Smittium simulii]|uniref:Uncharacterized protein n=1 Tax=Smittium simulii TaxID=133385 RepID=A0A2T9YJN0_9FUNG|nr:hypothetical protein BB561_003800 [Smittium simulii]
MSKLVALNKNNKLREDIDKKRRKAAIERHSQKTSTNSDNSKDIKNDDNKDSQQKSDSKNSNKYTLPTAFPSREGSNRARICTLNQTGSSADATNRPLTGGELTGMRQAQTGLSLLLYSIAFLALFRLVQFRQFSLFGHNALYGYFRLYMTSVATNKFLLEESNSFQGLPYIGCSLDALPL